MKPNKIFGGLSPTCPDGPRGCESYVCRPDSDGIYRHPARTDAAACESVGSDDPPLPRPCTERMDCLRSDPHSHADHAEVIRDGETLRTIPRQEIEAETIIRENNELIAETIRLAIRPPSVSPRPKLEDDLRDPVTILSGIWALASLIAEGPDEINAVYGDRIGVLCAELEAVLVRQQLEASLAARKERG